MAGTNSREVKLSLSVETLGADDIKKLQTTIESLGKTGGDAAPEFQRLADQIGRLGEQSKALDTFQELSDSTRELVSQEQEAAAATAELQAKLEAVQASTQQAAQKQQALKQAVIDAQRALADTNGELTILRNSYDENGDRVANYKSKLQELVVQKVAEKKALDEARLALKEGNDELKNAESAQSSLEKAYTRSAAQVQRMQQAVEESTAAMQAAATTAEGFGLATNDVASAQAKLIQALNATGTEAGQLESSLAAVRAEEERLAAQAAQSAADQKELITSLNSEIKLRQQQAAARTAAANEIAAAEKKIADQAAADAKAEQDESDRLAAIVIANREKMLAAGRNALLAEQAAWADSVATIKKYEAEKATAIETGTKEAAAAAAAAAQAAGQKISDAFGSVGVKSVDALQKEILQVRQAMETLRTDAGLTGGALAAAMAQGQSKINALELEIRQATDSLTTADKAAKLFSNSMGQIAAGNLLADGIGYLVNKVKELGQAFLDITVKTETARRAMTAIYGDTKTATTQLDFLSKTAQQAGVNVNGIQEEFVKFSAAMKGANVPLAQSNDLFNTVTRAAGSLGLSTERVGLVLEALGQIASKGTVSLEELKQQLGDSLPGALGIAARGLGVTEGQLIKLVESGKLATDDFIPAFTSGLKSLVAENDTLQGSFANLQNALTEVTKGLADAGVTDVLKGALLVLGTIIGNVVIALSGMVEGFLLVGKGAAALAASLTGSTDALQTFNDEVAASNARIQKQIDAMDRFTNGTNASTTAVDANTKSQQAQGAAQSATTSAVLAGAAAQAQQTAAIAGTTAAVSGAGNAYVQMLVKLTETQKQTEANILAAEKYAKAKKDEGEAQVEVAKLTGNAVTILQAQAAAETAAADAAKLVTAARQSEADATQRSIAAITALGAANGGLTEAQKGTIQSLQTTLTTQAAAAEQARQHAEKLSNAAVAANVATQAYNDNAKSLEGYKLGLKLATEEVGRNQTAVQSALAVVKELTDLQAAGKNVQDQLTLAQADARKAQEALNDSKRAAATYENLYRDAVSDSVKAMKLKAEQDASAANLANIAAGNEVKHYEALAKSAAASGNLALQVYYEIEAKRKQIEVTELAAKAKIAEANADIQILQAQRDALDQTDPLLKQKQAEIDLRIANAKAKILEAQSSEDVIRNLKTEIELLQQNTAARNSNADSIDKQTAAMENNTAAKTKNAGVDANGFSTDASGNTISAGGDLTTLTGIYNFLKSAGVTDDATAKSIAKEFSDSQGNIPYSNNPGQIKYGGDTLSAALLKAAERYTFSSTNSATVGGTTSSSSSGTSSTTSASSSSTTSSAAASTTTTVNIVINGKTTAVNVASATDASNLTSILQQLAAAAGTAA